MLALCLPIPAQSQIRCFSELWLLVSRREITLPTSGTDSHYISMRTRETCPREDSGRDWDLVSCRNFLQENIASLGETKRGQWSRREVRSRRGLGAESQEVLGGRPGCLLSLLDASLKHWNGGGLRGSQGTLSGAGTSLNPLSSFSLWQEPPHVAVPVLGELPCTAPFFPSLHTGPRRDHGQTVAPDPSQWVGPSVLSCALASWPLALSPALPSALSFLAVSLPFLVVTLLTHGTCLPHPAVLTQPKLTSNQRPEAQGSL